MKKKSLKLFYLIDRIIGKILIIHLKRPVLSYVGNFYQYGGPVPNKSVLDILLRFQSSINDHIPILTAVIERVFQLDHLQFWLNIFQCLMILLEATCSNISVLWLLSHVSANVHNQKWISKRIFYLWNMWFCFGHLLRLPSVPPAVWNSSDSHGTTQRFIQVSLLFVQHS